MASIFEDLMLQNASVTTDTDISTGMLTESVEPAKTSVPEVKKFNVSRFKFESRRVYESESFDELDKQFAVDPESEDEGEVVLVIDPEINAEDDLPEDAAEKAIGSYVYKCPVCGSNYLCNCDAELEEAVEVDDNGVPTECPICGDDAEQILVGEIAPVENAGEQVDNLDPVDPEDADENPEEVPAEGEGEGEENPEEGLEEGFFGKKKNDNTSNTHQVSASSIQVGDVVEHPTRKGSSTGVKDVQKQSNGSVVITFNDGAGTTKKYKSTDKVTVFNESVNIQVEDGVDTVVEGIFDKFKKNKSKSEEPPKEEEPKKEEPEDTPKEDTYTYQEWIEALEYAHKYWAEDGPRAGAMRLGDKCFGNLYNDVIAYMKDWMKSDGQKNFPHKAYAKHLEESLDEGLFGKKKKQQPSKQTSSGVSKWGVFDCWSNDMLVGTFDTKDEADKAAAGKGHDGRYAVRMYKSNTRTESAFNGGQAEGGFLDTGKRAGGAKKTWKDALDGKKTKTVKAKDLKPGMITSTGEVKSVTDNGMEVEVSYGGIGAQGSHAADVVDKDKEYQVLDESANDVNTETDELDFDEARFESLVNKNLDSTFKASPKMKVESIKIKGSKLMIEYKMHLGNKVSNGTLHCEGFDINKKIQRIVLKDKGIITESVGRESKFEARAMIRNGKLFIF